MVTNKHKDFVLRLYDECNNHAKEQAVRRDQVIAFYIVVCAFYLNWKICYELPLLILLNIAMILLGAICCLVLISFRSWIIQYGNCAEAVGKLLICDKTLKTQEEISLFLEVNCKKKSDSFIKYIKRMGNVVIIGFILITLAPFIKSYELLTRLCSCNAYAAIIVCIVAALYVYKLVSYHFKMSNMALTQENEITWIIRFNDFKE